MKSLRKKIYSKMRKRKTKKPRYSGGAFTGNQLYDLLNYAFSNNGEKFSSVNLVPLDATNNNLYNETFRVFYTPNGPDKIRFVVIHRGTKASAEDFKNLKESIKDWGNNARNTLVSSSLTNETLMTERNLRPKAGYKALNQYLIDLYNNKDTNADESKKIIIDSISKLINKKNSQIANISLHEAVDELLKNRLTTIGYSQGAIYAYLYGNRGKETIVYNPAPFRGKKPDNTYIIKQKGDVVSKLTDASDNANTQLAMIDNSANPKDPIANHSIDALNGIKEIFGNKFLYNYDDELKNDGQPSPENTFCEIVVNDDSSKSDGDSQNIRCKEEINVTGGKSTRMKRKRRYNVSKKRRNNV